jgi:BlaI family transcriptional regulator, penicillinase repressor
MTLFWKKGAMTAEAVREALPKPLRESTVRTLLRRITEKGYLTHSVEGRTYVYRAVDEPAEFAASGMRRLAQLLYRGSVGDLLVGLVDAKEIDQAELDALMARIQAARSPADGETGS